MPKRPLGTAAFTLMEMLVVLSIIAIVMGMGVAMYLHVARVDRLSAAARALEGGLRAARSQAILERRPVRFRFNCERRCFYAIREADEPNVNGVYGDDGITNSPNPAAFLSGSDLDFIAATSRESVFVDAPEYFEGSILVVRTDNTAPAPGSWEMLDWDVIFDASGRASVPADFAVSMRRIRLGTLEGDLGTIELSITPTTGEIVFRNL